MTLNEYQELAMRTANELSQMELVENGVIGGIGKIGEIADIYKKYRFQGHELDIKHIQEEIGDVLWYIAILAKGVGISLNEVAEQNVAKLKKRYPNGFESEKSINRED